MSTAVCVAGRNNHGNDATTQGTLCWAQGEWFHCELGGPIRFCIWRPRSENVTPESGLTCPGMPSGWAGGLNGERGQTL